MLGSLITRPLKIATRSVTIPYRLTRGAIDVAEGVAGLVLLRLRQRGDASQSSNGSAAEPTAWRPPAPNTMVQEPEARPAPRRAARTPRRESTNGSSPTSTPRATPSPRRSAPPATGAPRAGAPAAAPPAEPPVAPPLPEPATRAAAPEPEPSPAVVEPAHVSSEVELVEEFSDPGAEDGAGAQIRIDEPWEGYRQMKAADVVDRLASASREEIAAVELFETAGRKRKSVLAAAERALRQATPNQ